MFSERLITKSDNVLHLSLSCLFVSFLVCSELDQKCVDSFNMENGDELAIVTQRFYSEEEVKVLNSGKDAFTFVDNCEKVSNQVNKLMVKW